MSSTLFERPDVSPENVVTFWAEAGAARWYKKDADFDATIRARFSEAHHNAARGDLWDWEQNKDGALALILLLDQFPRNLFRDSAHAFATDAAALRVADRAIERGFDRMQSGPLRQFFYLPMMHAEDLAQQERCVAIFEALGAGFEENLKFAVMHRDIIADFGRFPHRNHVLARATTDAERAFLASGGFAG